MVAAHSNTILIVDDNPNNRELLSEILDGKGYNVRVASSGEEALQDISAPKPDLILLDVLMPGMSGYDVCQEVKKNPEYGLIPVIFLSALNDKQAKVNAFKAGGVDYITKPFAPDEVLVSVESHLERFLLNTSLVEAKVKAEKSEQLIRKQYVELELMKDQLTFQNEELERLNVDVNEEKSFYEMFINIVPGIFYVYEIIENRAKLIKWNQEHATVLGYDEEELEAMFLDDFIVSEELEVVANNLLLVENEQTVSVELKVKHKSGVEIPFYCQAKGFHKGDKKYFAGTGLDITEQRKAQEIIKNITDSVILTDFSDNFTYICPNIEFTFGYTADEVAQKQKLSALIPEINVIDKELVKNQEYSNVEFTIISKYGQKRTVLVNARMVLLQTEQILYVCRDVTERKKAEISLSESEDKFRDFANSVTDIYFALDKDLNYIFWNKACENALGYKNEEIIGKSYYDLDINKGFEWIADRYLQIIANGKSDSFESEFGEGENKVVFIVNVYPTKSGLVVYLQNITQLKKIEHDLLKSDERFNLAMKSTKDGLFDWNVETNQIYYSYGWKAMLGYEYDELKNEFKTWEDLTSPVGVKTTMIKVKEHFDNQTERFENEFQMQHKDGHWIDVFVRGSAVFNDEGKPVRVIGTHVDITKQKKVEKELLQHRNHLKYLVKERTEEVEQINEELRQTNEELASTNENLEAQKKELYLLVEELKKTQDQLVQSEKMASIGVLVAGVAHEINNPVNFISGSICGIKEELPYLKELVNACKTRYEEGTEISEEKLQEVETEFNDIFAIFDKTTKNINIGVERISKIIKGLLSFSYSNSKVVSHYNVNDNLDDTLIILNNQYKYNVVVEKNYGNIAPITCFAGQINQVWMNLISNAIQAIEGKGTIVISTQMKGKYTVEVSIKDSGKGIPDAIVKNIFDPFFTTKPVGKGTGLGLSIVYNNIQNNKGSIQVKSEEGNGSEFIVCLPVGISS